MHCEQKQKAKVVRQVEHKEDTFKHFGTCRIIRNGAFLGNELVHPAVRSTMTTSSNAAAAIQNGLNGQINLILARVGNLDTVAQCRQGTMGPATSTILGIGLE